MLPKGRSAPLLAVGSRPRPPSPGLWPIHLAHPRAGHFSLAGKVPKRAPGSPGPPFLSNRTTSDFAGTQPLDQKILRASDLRRVSRPASAVALLKGEMHLFFRIVPPAPMGNRQTSVREQEIAFSPRAVRQSTAGRRTGHEEAGGLMEIPWLPGIFSDTHRLGKKRGSGVSPAVFPPTFGRPKVGPPEATRGAGAEPPAISAGLWGWVGPHRKHWGRSPRSATSACPGCYCYSNHHRP